MSNQDVAIKESQTPAQQEVAVLNMIERVALDPNTDVEKLDRMLDVQERIMNKQAEMDFFSAMNKAQSEMTRISTDATNPQTKSAYASYAKLDRALRPLYVKHGMSLSFDTEASDIPDHLEIVCYVSHISGYTKRYSVPMSTSGKGAKGGAVMTETHATGAAMSYGMRYLLKMIFNVAIGEDDNDGNVETPVVASPELDAAVAKIVKAKTEKAMLSAAKSAYTKYTGASERTQIIAAKKDWKERHQERADGTAQ